MYQTFREILIGGAGEIHQKLLPGGCLRVVQSTCIIISNLKN